jgi:beta-fructofuranosidase
VSTDGISFKKYEKNPVIPGPPPGFEEDFRDPKVFRHGELWYMVAGCSKGGQGGILLYSSRDLRKWDYIGLACQSNGNQGTMWECPDLFELDGAWVLVVSPMNMKNSKCLFITGGMDFKAGNFEQQQYRDIDYGVEFYAPQTFRDERGRRILIAWMDMWGGDFHTQRHGWAGALTVPRELFIQDGEVWQRPVEEIALLRKKQLYCGSISLKDGKSNTLADIRGDRLEISFTLPVPAQKAGTFNMYLRASENRKEKTMFSYDFASGVFTVDRRQSGEGKGTLMHIPNRCGDAEIPVQILIDTSSVEFFLCGGRYTVTSRIYPQQSSVYYDMNTSGIGLSIPDFTVFELG